MLLAPEFLVLTSMDFGWVLYRRPAVLLTSYVQDAEVAFDSIVLGGKPDFFEEGLMLLCLGLLATFARIFSAENITDLMPPCHEQPFCGKEG